MYRLHVCLKRLNRIARADAIGTDDLVWLERKRAENNLDASLNPTQLVSKLQDIYAAKGRAAVPLGEDD